MEPWPQASAPNCYPFGFFHPREDWEAHLCPRPPCIQSSGFREAVNDSLELRTPRGISALLSEQLRRGFLAFVGLAITTEINKSLGGEGLRQGLTV